MLVRCAACSRPRTEGARCRCGVGAVTTTPPAVFDTLEGYFGIDPSEVVRPHAHLTLTFGLTPSLARPGIFEPLDSFPEGTRFVRRFRAATEVEWDGGGVADDERWENVFILHYRGPLSGATLGSVPRLRRLRELRDGTPGLYRALLAVPPPELTTFELHTPVEAFRGLVAQAHQFPSLQHLVVHFLEGEPGLVLMDELLERHEWLDRVPGEGASIVFRVRR